MVAARWNGALSWGRDNPTVGQGRLWAELGVLSDGGEQLLFGHSGPVAMFVHGGPEVQEVSVRSLQTADKEGLGESFPVGPWPVFGALDSSSWRTAGSVLGGRPAQVHVCPVRCPGEGFPHEVDVLSVGGCFPLVGVMRTGLLGDCHQIPKGLAWVRVGFRWNPLVVGGRYPCGEVHGLPRVRGDPRNPAEVRAGDAVLEASRRDHPVNPARDRSHKACGLIGRVRPLAKFQPARLVDLLLGEVEVANNGG